MSDYDNTNTAAIFSVDEDTKLVGSGKWNDNGFDRRIILIKHGTSLGAVNLCLNLI